MTDPYSGEWSKINEIAIKVQSLSERIEQLENQASAIRAQSSQMPREIDEDGNDINEGARNALRAQLESVNSLIEEANEAKQELSANANALASSYRQQAKVYTEKAQKTASAKTQFDALSRYRFGAGTAGNGAQLAGQREKHYEDHVSILNSLAIAARSAAYGVVISGGSQQVSERGTFKNPGGQNSRVNIRGSGRNATESTAHNNRSRNGVPGDSVKAAADKKASAVLRNLGMGGIPYKNGTPDFSGVSHAKVTAAMAGVGMVAAADAMLAKKYGVSGSEIAAYRKENGLAWIGNGDIGSADLVPQSISQAYSDGQAQQQEPTALEALTAYMCAHNYGKKDYDTYSKDPEWKRLHREAFPDHYRKELLNREVLRQGNIEKELQKNGISYENFSGYNVAPNIINGEYVVVGSVKNYQKYIEFQNNRSAYTLERCDERAFIPSRQIEGVWISQHDIEKPNGFWGMHNESFESWSQSIDIIPIIQQELNNGKSIEEIKSDAKLGKCASGFFDIGHSDPIRVYEIDGIYILEGGRHRTMIGQKMDINVPVRIVGRYKNK